MTLARARIIPRQALGSVAIERVTPLGSAQPQLPLGGNAFGQGGIARRPVVEAAVHAASIVKNAHLQAREVVAHAERRAAELTLQALVAARAEAALELAAKAVRLRQFENAGDERQLDRTLELARMLAERLLGQALSLDPNTILALAQQALLQAKGARRLRLDAHPSDAAVLRQELGLLGVEGEVLVSDDAERRRGDLRLTTEVGVIDAELGPQLERLAEKLRGSLRS